MTVLGLDPGFERLGYGFIVNDGETIKSPSFGLISTKKEDEKGVRFLQIYNDIETLVRERPPSIISMEKLIFAKNVKTVMTVSEVRGVIILISALHNLPLYEFTPLQVKMATTGYGRSDKKAVRTAVRMILSIPEIPGPDDISDALAIALCGFNSAMTRQKLKGALELT